MALISGLEIIIPFCRGLGKYSCIGYLIRSPAQVSVLYSFLLIPIYFILISTCAESIIKVEDGNNDLPIFDCNPSLINFQTERISTLSSFINRIFLVVCPPNKDSTS
ncbi:uncharacterized protein LOC133721361 [Rosa rugosa]|uniref:uncharacterized protein LOC133721361 n=1 Tax=Rosa rugosa TaxID=74645 RepID=UPI002B41421E|nr:uncharacterized protein LOC133721361 [Rosa rugosa]